MNTYLELAKKQFLELQEETLDEDRHSLGAENEIEYDEGGIKFRIVVDGFWEKSPWFEYHVFDEEGRVIESGTEY